MGLSDAPAAICASPVLMSFLQIAQTLKTQKKARLGIYSLLRFLELQERVRMGL